METLICVTGRYLSIFIKLSMFYNKRYADNRKLEPDKEAGIQPSSICKQLSAINTDDFLATGYVKQRPLGKNKPTTLEFPNTETKFK